MIDRARAGLRQWGFLLLAVLWGSSDLLAQENRPVRYAIAIHGGAGSIPKSDRWKKEREEVLTRALTLGKEMLEGGASSLDVVEKVIHILEDSEYFNAGRGAVCNAEGEHELDASIMDGKTRACGAVGGVRTIRNPISLARLVMTETPHVLLVTDGAEKFADEVGMQHGIERVPNSYFATEEQFRRLQEAQDKAAAKNREDDSKGTVGCVALDLHGNLAAGTSTGGMTNKRYGRIGDSPIIGAGTYADNRSCAVSCTGVGEDFIRYSVASDVSLRMRYRGQSLKEATHDVLHDPEHIVRGGLVAVDKDGNVALPFNSAGMARAAADSKGLWEVHVAE